MQPENVLFWNVQVKKRIFPLNTVYFISQQHVEYSEHLLNQNLET